MKTVRLEDGIVKEIIPEYALPVETWYGAAFAEKCTEAPDEVEQRWALIDGMWYSPDSIQESVTAAQLREQAYNTEKTILWEGEYLTVTEAAQLWQYYAAEGSDKANAITELIAAAKAEIRMMHPDVEV